MNGVFWIIECLEGSRWIVYRPGGHTRRNARYALRLYRAGNPEAKLRIRPYYRGDRS